VKTGCLAQLVNVIAPIMTNEKGLYLQTIYYPYRWALDYAHGSVLNILTESPTYEVSGMGQTPNLDVVGTQADNRGVSLFILNRDRSKGHTLEVNWQDKTPGRVLASLVLTGDDLKASNSFGAPRKVIPQEMGKPSTVSGRTTFEVPARSYAVIQWEP
jgi:alpha-N-arabinofuranosidase